MSNRLTKRTITLFESIKHVDESGNEYWTSRAMWRILSPKNIARINEKLRTFADEISGYTLTGA